MDFDLDKYASYCLTLAEEWTMLLSLDERFDTYRLISQYTYSEWLDWRAERHDVLRVLVSLSPSKRLKKLEKLSRDERLLTVFAASQYCVEAYELLLPVANRLYGGMSYRDMASNAGDIVKQISYGEMSVWHWDGPPAYKRPSD